MSKFYYKTYLLVRFYIKITIIIIIVISYIYRNQISILLLIILFKGCLKDSIMIIKKKGKGIT